MVRKSKSAVIDDDHNLMYIIRKRHKCSRLFTDTESRVQFFLGILVMFIIEMDPLYNTLRC
jgi:hypothetical protein